MLTFGKCIIKVFNHYTSPVLLLVYYNNY